MSGALTGIPYLADLRRLYENIARICADHQISLYLPHQHTDPQLHLAPSPQEVYLRDRDAVLQSQLVLVYLGERSVGVGIEAAIAAEHQIPLILIAPDSAAVSRIVLGAPTVQELVTFTDQEQLPKLLGAALERWRVRSQAVVAQTS